MSTSLLTATTARTKRHDRFSFVTWGILAWIVLVAVTPITATTWLSVEAVALSFGIGCAGIDFRLLFRRWKGLLLTVFLLAVFIAIGHPQRHEFGWFLLVVGMIMKNGILFATIASLSETVGQVRILRILTNFGVPRELTSTMSMMARYGPLLNDQSKRMQRARQSRMVRRSLPGLWLVQSGGLATLLASSLRRSQRIHAAMLSRGWQSSDRSVQ